MKEAYLKYLLDQKSAFVDVPIPKPSPTQLLIKFIVSGSNLKKVICVHNDGLMLDPDLYSCCPPRPRDKGAKTKIKTNFVATSSHPFSRDGVLHAACLVLPTTVLSACSV